MRPFRVALIFCALAAAVCLAPDAFGQIESTTACQPGDWDVLSVMMMDPGLASGYHMEGITKGLPSSYVYTMWDQSQSKVYYVKNPQGNPWDINIYDSNFIYQSVTELGTWHGVNHWNDPTSCRKFDNGSNNGTSDLSMRWAARCAIPGESTLWNPPPSAQPNNTKYITYVGQVRQRPAQNLAYSRLRVESTGTMMIADHRVSPPLLVPVTTLPLEYLYTCSVLDNSNSCKSREVFYYAVDTTVNPVDNIRHSYGWVRWQFYTNATLGNPNRPAVWVRSNSSTFDQLMPGQVGINFQCF